MHQRVPQKPTRHLISLIGMPSAGKTKLGRQLAERLKWAFVDTDDVIVNACKAQKLQDVVDRLSRAKFLKAEEDAVIKTVQTMSTSSVIATGGSVVYSERAMELLAKETHVIHVWASLTTVTRRIEKDPDRGLVLDPGETIADLFVRRMPLYCRWAHGTVDTNHSRSKAAKRLATQLLEDEIITLTPTPSR